MNVEKSRTNVGSRARMARSRARTRKVAHEWREVAHACRKSRTNAGSCARTAEVAHEWREVAHACGKSRTNGEKTRTNCAKSTTKVERAGKQRGTPRKQDEKHTRK